jgi:N-acetylglutamate synthase-like GNAT family acetyltransferase
VFGCAQLQDLGNSPDGLRVAEVAAFTISSDYRGGGRGDSLLDYVEQRARADVRPLTRFPPSATVDGAKNNG